MGAVPASASARAQMHVVVVGHLDHGKSTVIGRLLADSGSLPDGKLEQVRAMCERNARPFEYAFLLDALKNEQAQGITIDTARCFFRTAARDYVVHDAPGHIEFLKNMVTGAARAGAALLVIDAQEGIRENSKRHGYVLSMLGVRQVSVIVNKMDLMGYRREAFEAIRDEYGAFLRRLAVSPVSFIPVSAREGANVTTRSPETAWYEGPTVLEQVEAFVPAPDRAGLPFRLPVQDVYKFTEDGDSRRIVAGTVETGTAAPGDAVVFLPSGKRSTIGSSEEFGLGGGGAVRAGRAVGVTLTEQVYVKPGEVMCRAGDALPRVSRRFRANLFWMGHAPMVRERSYRLKLGAARVQVQLAEVVNVLDASELSTVAGRQQVERHDVAECLLETARPVAFDLHADLEGTGRFVIVDEFRIAGCGIILEDAGAGRSILRERVDRRENAWETGLVTRAMRERRFRHPGKFIVFTGPGGADVRDLARRVEAHLFERECMSYYLGIRNVSADLAEGGRRAPADDELRRLGELARIMTDAGVLVITTLGDVEDHDLETLRILNEPNEVFVVAVGGNPFTAFRPQVEVPAGPASAEAVAAVVQGLQSRELVPDYSI